VRQAVSFVPGLILSLAVISTVSAQATELDRVLASENAGKNVKTAPVADDLAFLRRIYVDLIGRIPNASEIAEFQGWTASERRNRVIDKLLKDDRFTDRWTVFFADMLRIRSNQTGGTQFMAFVHQALKDGMPYDEMIRRMVSANGKAGKTPEVGFVLGDDADPMALAGATAQTFLGIRIACAECHDHPFDKWTREEFYGLAAFFGKTQRVEQRVGRSVYTTEGKENRVMWPPAAPGVGQRKPVTPQFLYQIDNKNMKPHVDRMLAGRAAEAKAQASARKKDTTVDDLLAGVDTKVVEKKQPAFDVAGQANSDIKKIDVEADLYKKSELRHHLAATITDPYNRYFSWALANRAWKELIGRGIVEPIDDFRSENKPSHPKTLDYIANEFVGSGFDFRSLVRMIVSSDVYQRGRYSGLDEATRVAAEEAFVASPMRRMPSEALFDSVVEAGHLWKEKYPDGMNKRTLRQMVQVRVDEAGKPVAPKAPEKGKKGGDDKMMASGGGSMMAMKPMGGGGYSLEMAIEVDFSKVLAEAMKDDEPKIEMMEAVSPEDLEARKMVEARPANRPRYVTKYVDVTVDYNPKFNSSMRMESPAPRPHFLRVFGQPAREALGEQRDALPSMRQALMLLNGSLTHEASRVGPLEPMHKLIAGKTANIDAAIKLAYKEIMTREPSADEIAFAKEVIAGGETPIDGMADLRWALLNCNEFRYLP
jgi:hypothetical protein